MAIEVTALASSSPGSVEQPLFPRTLPRTDYVLPLSFSPHFLPLSLSLFLSSIPTRPYLSLHLLSFHLSNLSFYIRHARTLAHTFSLTAARGTTDPQGTFSSNVNPFKLRTRKAGVEPVFFRCVPRGTGDHA